MSTVVNLKAREKMENRLDELIDKAEKLVNSANIATEAAELESSQLRNLLNITSSTDSFKAVELYIQYQMGRAKEGKGWRYGGFGGQLIQELQKLDDLAEQIGRETNEEKVKVKMELVRLFIGYLTRYFSYKSSEQRKTKQEEPS